MDTNRETNSGIPAPEVSDRPRSQILTIRNFCVGHPWISACTAICMLVAFAAVFELITAATARGLLILGVILLALVKTPVWLLKVYREAQAKSAALAKRSQAEVKNSESKPALAEFVQPAASTLPTDVPSDKSSEDKSWLVALYGWLIIFGVVCAILFAPDTSPSETAETSAYTETSHPLDGIPVTSIKPPSGRMPPTGRPADKPPAGKSEPGPLLSGKRTRGKTSGAKLLVETINKLWQDDSSTDTTAEMPPLPPAPVPAVNGQSTVDYWKATVADLHLIRFGDFTAEELAMTVNTYEEKMRTRWRSARAKAEKSTLGGVDPELIQLVNRHWDIDRRMLLFQEEFTKWAQQQPLFRNVSVKQSEEQLDAVWGNLTEEKFQQLPMQIQDMLTRAVRLSEEVEIMFEEIEEMQHKLNEKYKPLVFALPNVGEA